MSDAPWQRGLGRRPPYQIQEENFSKGRIGTRKQPNSGRRWYAKGDVLQSFSRILSKVLIDNKGPTEKESYTIDRKQWLQGRRLANQTPPGCVHAQQVTLKDVHLLVIELSLWDTLTEHIVYLEGLLEQRDDAAD